MLHSCKIMYIHLKDNYRKWMKKTQDPQFSKTAVLKNRMLKNRRTKKPQYQKPQYSKTAELKNRNTQKPQFLKYDSCKKKSFTKNVDNCP